MAGSAWPTAGDVGVDGVMTSAGGGRRRARPPAGLSTGAGEGYRGLR